MRLRASVGSIYDSVKDVLILKCLGTSRWPPSWCWFDCQLGRSLRSRLANAATAVRLLSKHLNALRVKLHCEGTVEFQGTGGLITL